MNSPAISIPVSRTTDESERGWFTVDGSGALECDLDRLCIQVLHRVESIIPESRLVALVLGGGYGRGEGGVLKTDSGDRPYNDLEFYVFLKGNRLLNERRYRRLLGLLGDELSPKAGVHVEFKVDSLERFRRGPVTMYSYDLVAGHRVLWPTRGSLIFAGCEQHLDAGNIPLQEATRLLLNRCTGLLLAKEMLRQSELPYEQTDFIGRNLAKAQLAMGDAVLAAHGQYHWSCLERRDRLSRLEIRSQAAWFPEVQRQHQVGVDFKLHPRQVFKSGKQLLAEHRDISNLALQLWLWLESRRLNRPLSSIREYAFGLVDRCSDTSLCRNLLLNVRTFGPGSLFDRMAAFYPRERLLKSLPLLLWEEPLNDLKVKCHLQHQLRTSAQDWQSFVSAYKSLWSSFS